MYFEIIAYTETSATAYWTCPMDQVNIKERTTYILFWNQIVSYKRKRIYLLKMNPEWNKADPAIRDV